MINDTIIIVPSYNAASSIQKVINEIRSTGYTNIIIGDDCSEDNTVSLVKNLFPEIPIITQSENIGYGGNQKALYQFALNKGYKYVVMIHGDNQYTPYLAPSLVSMLHYAKYDFVFGSRITGGNALKGGMPLYKYIFNRMLTLVQNIITGYKLSEYHSGLRAFKCSSLKELNFDNYSNDFVFDNQVILGIIKSRLRIGEVSCETVYNHSSSSINFKRSVKYGLGVLKETYKFLVGK